MGPSVRSRAISSALRLGVRPIIHRIPGHAGGIRTARSTVDAAALLIRPSSRVRVLPLNDPQLGTGRDEHPITGEWVVARDTERTTGGDKRTAGGDQHTAGDDKRTTGGDPATAGDDERTARGDQGTAGGAVLYLHGGGYVVCSPRTHRPITSRLALDTGLPVLVPRYRLAPEHPFPAPLEDAVAAYRWLLARGVPASGIVVAGDSAGGHLAATLTGEICRLGLPRPAGLVLLSPWVDLTCEISLRAQQRARDPYISAVSARRVARLVVGPAGFDDPRLALLTCAWTDTPPVLIQVGGDEVLRPEAEALADALTSAGADCELQVWEGQMHVFQILNRVLPEAAAAMRDAAHFIRTVTTPAAAERPGAEAA